MATNAPPSNAPLIANEGGGNERPAEDVKKQCARVTGKIVGGIGLLAFVIVWFVQICCWWVGQVGCSERSSSFAEDQADKGLPPRIQIVTEAPPHTLSDMFEVFEGHESSVDAGAPKGTWYATWGPIFTTYVYQDTATSRYILYMRRNLLNLGMSHRVQRCDGRGSEWIFKEGGGYFTNRIRLAFGYNQAITLGLYRDGNSVGRIEETNQGTPALNFIQSIAHNDETVANAFLDPASHMFEHWKVDNKVECDDKHTSNCLHHARPEYAVPYWVSGAATVLYAEAHIHTREAAAAKAKAQAEKSKPHRVMLIENTSMPLSLAMNESIPLVQEQHV